MVYREPFTGLIEYISRNYSGKIVEVCSGKMFRVAIELKKRGFDVICVDVKAIDTPDIRFIQDDIINPKDEIYSNASLIYSIRPPYELYKHILKIAEKNNADCIIKPFYGEIPEEFRLMNYRGDHFYIRKFSKNHPKILK
jgi:hypothetical protein